MNDPETLAAQNGFSHWAQMNMAAAVPLAEVRDMCAADRCGRYGHNWACPPGCGSLETAARRIAGYACGILVQTTGTLQDDFDYATIEAVGAAHKRRFAGFADMYEEFISYSGPEITTKISQWIRKKFMSITDDNSF